MKLYTTPKINRNDKKWYIEFSFRIPPVLWDRYNRKTKRFKKYGNINQFTGDEREKEAEKLRSDWEYALKYYNYNPFLDEIALLENVTKNDALIERKEEVLKNLSIEEKRQQMSIKDAFADFVQSRVNRRLENKSVVAYQATVEWTLEGLSQFRFDEICVGKLKHLHFSAALDYISKKRNWSATTINKEIRFLLTILNWFENEDYVQKNPSKGKFQKLHAKVTRHKWYDREMANRVKKALVKDEVILRACQFVYWILIRSNNELRELQIRDIDTTLKRIRFRPELSKNKTEQYRDYPDEFGQIINEMGLNKYPDSYYVFGKGGVPSRAKCGSNFLSARFKIIKDELKLSHDYTIYGWKHTRIVHEMMKGTDGYHISHLARHSDHKTTDDYKRDYDITLVNVYQKEDLTF